MGLKLWLARFFISSGDIRYSHKAMAYYKKIGLLNAVVKNVAERRQQSVIKDLILKYQPDMLVLTGHDRMLEQNKRFYDIKNYRNSLNFIKTVENARQVIPSMDDLVIFAGACQSYFEELIESGANFASSPARVLIDFMDPIVIATKIATTPENRYVTLSEILPEVREGAKGIGGTRRKRKIENNKLNCVNTYFSISVIFCFGPLGTGYFGENFSC